jgi:predicted HAD superfamily Cof-like phosphohydrolase
VISNPWQRLVADFHEKYGQPVLDRPQFPSAERIALRLKLMRGEHNELIDGLLARDMVEVADGLCDSIFTELGTACELGINLAPMFAEVSRSNMTKSQAKDASGKVVKGPLFEPPNLRALLLAQGWKP